MDEAQYCVILREGVDKGLRQYFLISEEKVKNAFDSFEFNNNGDVHMDMGYVVGNKKGEVSAKAYFNKKRIGSLEIKAGNKEEANKCAKYWGFDAPFDN